MLQLTPEQIKEIAGELDCGLTLYYNKQSNDLLFVPNPDNPDIEIEDWEEDFNKIKKHRNDYLVIEPPGSSDSFDIMAQFAGTLSDNNLKRVLTQSLNKKNRLENLNLSLIAPEILDKNGLILKMKNCRSGLNTNWRVIIMNEIRI